MMHVGLSFKLAIQMRNAKFMIGIEETRRGIEETRRGS